MLGFVCGGGGLGVWAADGGVGGEEKGEGGEVEGEGGRGRGGVGEGEGGEISEVGVPGGVSGVLG